MGQRLKDRVCVVTGAASGIGHAVALAMRDEGASVEGIDLQQRDDVPLLRADVSDEKSVGCAVSTILQRHGRVDVLVNCAGILEVGTTVSTDPEAWDRVFGVNVRGIYLVCRAVIPSMESRHAGSIVNIASNYALAAGRNCAAYTASKGAVVALTRAMALDHAPSGIRANCVCPGTVDTPLSRAPMQFMTKDDATNYAANRAARHPIGRIAVPADIVPGIIYLSSDEASFITGSVLVIDGGYTAQ